MAETRHDSRAVGISNRESPQEEAEERQEHPPIGTGSAAPDDSAPNKQGARSSAQKGAESKYTDRPMPATSKTDGAFGREGS